MKKSKKILLSTIALGALSIGIAFPLTSCNLYKQELGTQLEPDLPESIPPINGGSNSDNSNGSNNENDSNNGGSNGDNSSGSNNENDSNNGGSNGDNSNGSNNENDSNNGGSNGDNSNGSNNEDTPIISNDDKEVLEIFNDSNIWTDNKLNKFNEFISNKQKMIEVFKEFVKLKYESEASNPFTNTQLWVKEELKNESSKIYDEFLFKNQSDVSKIKDILKSNVKRYDLFLYVFTNILLNKPINNNGNNIRPNNNILSFEINEYNDGLNVCDLLNVKIIQKNTNPIDFIDINFNKIIKNGKIVGFKIDSINMEFKSVIYTLDVSWSEQASVLVSNSRDQTLNILPFGFNMNQNMLKFIIEKFNSENK